MQVDTLFKLLNDKIVEDAIILQPDPVLSAARRALYEGKGQEEQALLDLDFLAANLRQVFLSIFFDYIDWPLNLPVRRAKYMGAEIHGLKASLLIKLGRFDEAVEAILAGSSYTDIYPDIRSQLNEMVTDLPDPKLPLLVKRQQEDNYAVYTAELRKFDLQGDFVILKLKDDALQIPNFGFDLIMLPHEIFEISALQNKGLSQEIVAASLNKMIQRLEPLGPSRLLAENKICFSRTLAKAAKTDDRIISVVEGIEILQSLGSTSGLGRAILELGSALEARELFTEALRCLELAVRQLIADNDRGAIALSYYRQSVIARKMTLFTIAIRLLTRAFDMLQEVSDDRFLSQLYSEYVHNYLELGMNESALKFITLMIGLNKEHYLPYLRRAGIYAVNKNILDALADYRNAIYCYVREQNQTKSDQFSGANRNYEDSIFREAIWFCCQHDFAAAGLELLLLSQAGNINNRSSDWGKRNIAPEIQARSAEFAKRCFESAGDRLAQEKLSRAVEFLITESEILSTTSITNVDAVIKNLKVVETAQSALGEDTCLIASVFLKDDVWLFYLSSHRVICRRSVFSVASMKHLCGSFDGTESVYEQLEPLLEDLLEPVAKEFGSPKNLIFAMDPAIYGIPLHSLKYRGKFLVEYYLVSYITNAWDFLQTDMYMNTFGDPVIAACSAASYEVNLHELELGEEISKFTQLFPAARVIHTASDILTLADSQPDILHFACHGVYEAERPLFSRLVLKDRPLYAFEIILSGIKSRIVFINACDTANGKLLAGGYIRNLAAAFVRSGVRYVIASLWPVEDFAADFFMNAFYNAVLSGTSAAKALNDAHLAMIAISAYSDPEIWAPYILYAGASAV